jgi:hypothetical protein
MVVIGPKRHDVSMTWEAPEVTGEGGSLVAGEREMLDGYLNFHRDNGHADMVRERVDGAIGF